MKKIYLFIIVCLQVSSVFSASIYYSKSTGNLNTLGTWGTNTNGTGTSPLNFTTANCTYIIVNNASATIAAAWTVSGANSIIQVGNGTQSINFTIPTTAADRVTGTITVTNSGTLTINNATNPTLGTLSVGSTVVYSDAAAQTVLNATYDNLTLGGSGTKSLANTTNTIVNNILTINSGVVFALNSTATLNTALNGTISGAGTITGGTRSILNIGGTGSFGTLIPTGGTQTLNGLSINRASLGVVTLGGSFTIPTAFALSNGVLDLNGHTLTISGGTATFPATSTNGTISGSSASGLSISATTITNDLFMTAGAQTLSGLTLNTTQTLALGSDLTVSGAFTQTKGIINLNGHTLTLSGTATFATTPANGTLTGSTTSSLLISATAITNDLLMTTGAQTLNNFTFNSLAKTLILGTNLTVVGNYNHTNGILRLNGMTLTLSGVVVFPVASTNGTVTGTTTSNLIINGTSISNTLFFTTGALTLNNLTLNSAGKTLTLGTGLTVSGAFTQTNGILNLNGQTLTLSGTIAFPAASTNGTISGSSASGLSISATTITNDLFMTAGAQTLSGLTLNTTQTLALGSDLTVSGAFTQTKGIINLNGHTLTLSGTATFATTPANGTITGSTTSSLLISATAITNDLLMTTGAQTLNNFTFNSLAKTLILGTNLTVVGNYNHTNGILRLNGMTLTLSGVVVFPIASTNGTVTGTTTSNLIINGTSISNTLFFTTGALTLNNLTLNSAGQTLTLGTALTLSGTLTHTSGILNLNGQTLTCNGPVIFPTSAANGSFTGSPTSALSIGTAGGGAVTNLMYMTQTSSSTKSLNNLTFNRTAGTLTLGNALNLIGTLTPTLGTFASAGNLTLIASSPTVTARIAAIGGSVTGNVTVQSYAKGGKTGWTNLGSAGITGRTFSDWNDNFTITCASCPNGYNVGGTNFGSIQQYKETVGGLFSNASRYVEITSVTNAMTIGQGFWVYLGNGTTTSTDIIMDVSGPVNQGAFTFNLTYSAIAPGTAGTDWGWNLISNPYPSPITWTSLRNGNAKVSNAIYVYNPDLTAYSSYVNGVSSPATTAGGIANLIPAGQAFYVKISSLTTLVAQESYKAASTQPLLRTTSSANQTAATTSNPMVLRLSATGAGMENETAMYFDANASTNFEDQYDALSLGVGLPGFVNIVTTLKDTDYAINGLPALNQNMSIPVKITTGTTGSYQIAAGDIQNLPSGACVILHDNYLNLNQDLRTGPYTTTLNDTETVSRFVLNITINTNLQVSGSSKKPDCASSSSGYMVAKANSGAGPWNYFWKDASNTVIKTSLNKTTADTLQNANAGNYSVDVNTAGACDNGTLTFNLQGIFSPSAAYTIPSSTIQFIADSVPVSFTNTSANETNYLWDFGDGSASTLANPTHYYTSPANYNAILYAYNTHCTDTSVYSQTISIVLDTASATGINTVKSSSNMVISRDAEGYFVKFNYTNPINAVISVQNTLGQKVVDDISAVKVADAKIYIPFNSDSKVLILSVTASNGEKTFYKIINY